MSDRPDRTWELERYVLGALPEVRLEELRKLESRDPETAAAVERLRESDREFRGRHPTLTMIPGILRRARALPAKDETGRRGLFLLAPAAAAAILAIFFIVVPAPQSRTPYFRVKGMDAVDRTKTQILVFKYEKKNPFLLKDGDTVTAGDILQLAYVPAGMTHGVIFSIDGRGLVTLHYPDADGGSTLLKQEPQVLLRTAYELDRAPRFERFFFIFAPEAIDIRDILRKAEALARSNDASKTAPLPLPALWGQYSLILKKGAE